MDTETTATEPVREASAEPVRGASTEPVDDVRAERRDRVEQQPLPFDDESDQPVPYALTARARRAVAPESLPPLTVVEGRGSAGRATRGPDDGALERPDDTRPSRARALRRAGATVAAISRQLDVDELTVRAWLGSLAPRGPRVLPVPDASPADEAASSQADRARRRDAARADARQRLAEDAVFAAGLGLAAATVRIDGDAVSAELDDPAVGARLVRWLIREAHAAPARLRAVVQVGADVEGDVARHRWARRLGIDLAQVAFTRWRGAPGPHAERALLHVTDPATADAVAGARDALLDEQAPDPVDAAF